MYAPACLHPMAAESSRYGFGRVDKRQPAMMVGRLKGQEQFELALEAFGNGAAHAAADGDLVDRANRRDLGGRPREENFISDIEHLPRDHLLDELQPDATAKLHYGVPRDTGKYGVAQRWCVDLAVPDDEDILTTAFRYIARGIERDAFAIAVQHRLHLDQLRIHVVRSYLGDGGQGIGRQACP